MLNRTESHRIALFRIELPKNRIESGTEVNRNSSYRQDFNVSQNTSYCWRCIEMHI